MTKPEQLVNAPTAYHSVTNLADLQPPTKHLEPRIITDTPGTIEVDQEQPTLRDRIRRAGRGMLQGAGIAVTMGGVLATVWFGYKPWRTTRLPRPFWKRKIISNESLLILICRITRPNWILPRKIANLYFGQH